MDGCEHRLAWDDERGVVVCTSCWQRFQISSNTPSLAAKLDEYQAAQLDARR